MAQLRKGRFIIKTFHIQGFRFQKYSKIAQQKQTIKVVVVIGIHVTEVQILITSVIVDLHINLDMLMLKSIVNENIPIKD